MIYIHFPFCKSFCTYCDFYSVREKDRISQYTQSLLREISLRKAFLCRCTSPATLYVGGGTPSLWPVEQLGEVVAAISAVLREGAADCGRSCGGGGAVPGTWNGRGDAGLFAEFTVEVNPDDVTEAYARALRRLGVNRVSMGVQSFRDRSLRWMARRHSSAGAVEAFRVLRSAGFDNISLDLIFGYDPVGWGSGSSADGDLAGRSCGSSCGSRTGQLRSSSDEELMQLWSDDLDAVLRLRPEHISAYQMGIEEGSVLGEMTAAGRYREPSDELCAAQYALMQQRLAAAGYEQYEVSNFSLPGRRALHNSGYWDRSPYIGLGPGAHSFDGDRRRWWNAPDLDRYIAAFGGGDASGAAPACRDCTVPSVSSEENLTDEDIFTETVMLGLRTVDGLPLDVLVAMCRPSSSTVPDSRPGSAQPSSSTVPDSRSGSAQPSSSTVPDSRPGSAQPSSSTVPDSRSGAAENSCQSLLSQLPHPLRTSVDRLLATGSLILRDDRLFFPPSRLFISDSIIRELL